jgi:hypothetical protein
MTRFAPGMLRFCGVAQKTYLSCFSSQLSDLAPNEQVTKKKQLGKSSRSLFSMTPLPGTLSYIDLTREMSVFFEALL